MTTRIITGVVLGVLAVVVVVHGGLIFFLLMLALALLGLNEFYRLTRKYRPLPLAGFLGVALMAGMAWFYSPFAVFGAVCAGVLFTALLGLLAGPKPGVTVRMAVTVLGMLYVGLGFSAVLLMRQLDVGTAVLLTVIFGTWAGDTMAYFTGKFFGSTPMAPVLSPKKTWEGFAGGAISTVLLVVFIGLYTPLGAADSLVLGAVIAVAGPLGDLFESLVKRDVQIKDSGRGIPGHGGVLDRFDALIFSSVSAYFVLTLVLGF
ncbi:MAG TPA: phosphatidate cytidylyltransferase [Thermoleophilia bacterium]|nr:phosphatidate cytidylyltransferase [Thermoleophilia bacterium]